MDYKKIKNSKTTLTEKEIGYCINDVKAVEWFKNRERLTNAEWLDFLSEQFNISRTSAKEMLHVMMSVKKEDNFKKLFHRNDGEKEGRIE